MASLAAATATAVAAQQRDNRPRGSFQDERPHPSRGGNAYPDAVRHDVLTRWRLGIPLDSPELNLLRAQQPPAYPSMATCLNWINRERELGHARPMFPTGNHVAEREIMGDALVNLALYRLVHPEAPIDHVRAFLFNMDPTVAPYCHSAVVKAEHLLKLTLKKSSTTCERAYWAINLLKRERFWTLNYPFGRNNIRTRDMIDMDEAGFKIEATNPCYGKSVSWSRCHTEGAYNRDRKLNCMMGISADPAINMCWHDLWPQSEGGTNLYRAYRFFERIIDWLDVHHPGRVFCFTMDNLNIHSHPALLNLITSRGHRYLFRAPYWSVDGPMEYVFNAIHVKLLLFFRQIEDLDQLGNALDQIIGQLSPAGFLAFFSHVGFPNT